MPVIVFAFLDHAIGYLTTGKWQSLGVPGSQPKLNHMPARVGSGNGIQLPFRSALADPHSRCLAKK